MINLDGIDMKTVALAAKAKWPGAKFAAIRLKDGNTRIEWDHNSPVLEKTIEEIKQAQDEYVSLKKWLDDIRSTDAEMPRYLEDYIDENHASGSTLAPGRVKDNYDNKKEIRARKP